MPATLIDGKAYSAQLRGEIAAQVKIAKARSGKVPGLAVVLVGDNPASQVYVSSKEKQTLEAGMASFAYRLPENVTERELLGQVYALNNDPTVHGILVQLPLPKHIAERAVIEAISPDKDVDGFHVINSGRLATGQPAFVPCTPLGCKLLLQHYVGDISGAHAVVLGRSNIVGKPMAQLLLDMNATVTIAHSRTRDIPSITRTADILVAAVGKPELVKADWVKQDAVVIDVGINRLPPETEGGKGRIVGDVAFDEVSRKASFITPVPGGVGPMTIACLLHNTLEAFCRIEKISLA